MERWIWEKFTPSWTQPQSEESAVRSKNLSYRGCQYAGPLTKLIKSIRPEGPWSEADKADRWKDFKVLDGPATESVSLWFFHWNGYFPRGV